MEQIPVPQQLEGLTGDVRKHLVEHKDKWRAARLVRIEDPVDLELYRSDGTLVGSIQGRALSSLTNQKTSLTRILSTMS